MYKKLDIPFLILIVLFVSIASYIQLKERYVTKTLYAPKDYKFIPAPRTKTTDCKVQGPQPDPACTPGAVFPNVTLKQLCTKGYTKSVRNVSKKLKDSMYLQYGITSHKTGDYEMDHYISLELGGSNDPANLWPEAALPKPGFREKDVVENYLHKQMCLGKITLDQAQKGITKDWLKIYYVLKPKNPWQQIYMQLINTQYL